MLTADTREQAFFFIYGPSATGKTVFIWTVAVVLGDYAETTAAETFMASRGDRHPTELASLDGARLVTASEIEDGRRWAEARIKLLTGGDRVSARLMHRDPYSFIPVCKLVFAGNHRPGIRNIGAALRRRLHVIPFEVVIPDEDQDRELR